MGDNVVVAVSEGKLRGKTCIDYNGRSYNSFQGIPYAKPPLGELRFMPPKPPEKWKDIRDATQEGHQCYSKSLITNIFEGSEDCLFLNVYTPKMNEKKLLSVMFWIHGGGFVKGSGGSELFGPDYLIEKNVVLVTINYRLGPLGFLAFANPTLGVTGNAGLKDIVMALKWVQRNINRFSGDPKNVTIFGESAGGVAVHLLILSTMAKGLFHKAIMQSGCSLNCFARGRHSSTYELAHELDIHTDDDNLILSELRNVSVQELLEASQKIWDTFLISNIRPFGLVIEPKTEEAFLSDEPLSIIKSGRYNKVPMMMGYTSLEGIFIYQCLKSKPNYFLADATLVPHTMNLRINSVPYKNVAQKIRTMYEITGTENIKVDADLEKAIKVYTHNFFMIDVCRSAMLHSKNNGFPLYFYRFDLDTSLNVMNKLTRVKIKGPGHADDLFYLFRTAVVPLPDINSEEHILIQKITKLWTNFAKYGNPTSPLDTDIQLNWMAASVDNFHYLSIQNNDTCTRTDPEGEFVDFWENLFAENQFNQSKL